MTDPAASTAGRAAAIALGFAAALPGAAAPIAPGTKIGLDFGPIATDVAGNDWIEITANATLAAGTVKDLNAVVVDGVSITTSNGQFWNDDGSNDWVALATNPATIPGPKLPPEFVDSVTTDIAGNYSLGDATPYTITIAGLDPALVYDISTASTAAAGLTVIDTWLVTGASSHGPSGVVRSTADSNGVWHSFPAVEPTPAGTITLTVTDAASSANPIANGILIAAASPANPDTDADGLPDAFEQQIIDFDPGDAVAGLTDVAGPNDAPATTDFDADGSSDAEEFARDTNPTDPDSDDDGLPDGVESATGSFESPAATGTSPTDPDSDDDGLLDGAETNDGTFDGPADTGTDPNRFDTDLDAWGDGAEVNAGSDPTDPDDMPFTTRITRAGLIQDLDADRGVLEAGGAGTGVTRWSNQAGGGDDLLPGAGTPLLVAGPNGHQAVRVGQGIKLVGDDDACFDSLANGGGFTWFVVIDSAAQNHAADNRVFGTLRNGSPWPGVMACVASTNRPLAVTRSDGASETATGTTDVSAGWHIVAGRLAAGTGTAQQSIFTNGGTAQDTISLTVRSSADSGALTVGAERTGGVEYYDGDIARILIYDRPLTDDELNDTGFSLAASYGIPSQFVPSPPHAPEIASLPATDVRGTTATLNGELLDHGNDATTVHACWGDDDAGETLAAWDHSAVLGTIPLGPAAHPVTGLAGGTPCFFRWHAANSAGSAWSQPQSFTPGPPLLTVAAAQALEGGSGPTAVQFLVTLSYPAESEVTFHYATAHVSTDDSDFTPAAGQVTIPAGAAEATITVWVNGDPDEENDEQFVLRITDAGGCSVTTGEVAGVILSDDGDHLSPVAVAADGAAGLAYVALQSARRIAVVDAAGEQFLRSIPLPDPPNGLCLDAAGTRLYVAGGGAAGRIHVIDTASSEILHSWDAGHTPLAPVLGPAELELWVCNRFDNDVSVIDAATGATLARVPVEREPHAAAVAAGGSLFVANLLPTGPATAADIAAHVSVIDTAARSVTGHVSLPTGSHSLRGLCASPDGATVYVTHVLSRYYAPTTQVTRGWMNTNALTVIDAAAASRANTILLDDLDEGAANPWGVACSPDGTWLCAAHAGSHEVSVIDRAALAAKLAATTTDASNDLTWLAGLRRRVPLGGNGPRGLAIAAGKAFAAEFFSDSLAVADLLEGASPVGREVAVGWKKPPDTVRLGEMFYNDANLCLQQWQSCASCHPDGRSDGLNWDLINDGFGNPKNSKSFVTSMATPPAMATGIRANAQVAVRAGFRYIQFANRDESCAAAVDAYLAALEPVPSPHLENGQLSQAALNGQAHFLARGCAECHSGPHFTDLRKYDMGTGIGREAGWEFDTPTLLENWRSAPYLHDGRAATLRDVIETEHHGNVGGLSPVQIDELVAYLLSL